MNEKEFFESIKPLISEYMGYSVEEIKKEWDDVKKSSELEIEEKNRKIEELKETRNNLRKSSNDANDIRRFANKKVGKYSKMYTATDEQTREILEQRIKSNIEYRELKRDLEKTKDEFAKQENAINQLIEMRIEARKQVQNDIYDKAKQFIDSNKEKMNKNIEEKNNQFEEIREKRSKAINEKVKAYNLRKMVLNQAGKNSIVYQAADEDVRIKLSKYKEVDREFKSKKEELEQAQEELAGFEEIYDNIDFESEAGIQTLISITGWQEQLEKEEGKKEEAQREKGESRQEITKFEEKENVKKIFEEKEKYFEDILPVDYLIIKYSILGMKDIDENTQNKLEKIKDMTIIEILQEELLKHENDSWENKDRIRESIDALRNRDKMLLDDFTEEGAIISNRELAIWCSENMGKESSLIEALEFIFEEKEKNLENSLTDNYKFMKNKYFEDIDNFSASIDSEDEDVVKFIEERLMHICTMTLEEIIQEFEKEFKLLNEKELKGKECEEEKEPEAKEPEEKEPEAKEPEAKEPEAKEPEAKEPETKEPEAKEPETKEPEEKEPEAKEPETKEPETKEPEAKEPEAKEPETKEPETKEPEAKEPDKKESELVTLKINALYGAKYDKYNISNIDEKSKRIIISKQDLDIDRIAKRELAEKLHKVVDPIGIDTYLLMALYKYDKLYNTNTVDKYIKIITKNVSPSEKRKEMKESGLQIEYNLTNLYKSSLSKEQRKEILEIANISKEKGIATVKKGFRVKARETWDNIKDMLPKKTKFKLFQINRNDHLKDISTEKEENDHLKDISTEKEENDHLKDISTEKEENDHLKDSSAEIEESNNILRMKSLMEVGKAKVDSYKSGLGAGISQERQRAISAEIREKIAAEDEMGYYIEDEESILD